MKYALVVGGGKIGYYLAKSLGKSGYHVGMVEADPARAAEVADDLDITVVTGDGTEPETLRSADAEEANYVVAVTGKDETNLAVCQMAKKLFNVPQVIARVINPDSENVYKILGIDATISTTEMATEMIEKILPANGMRISQIFSQGDVELAEVELDEHSPVTGTAVSSVKLPEESVLIAIIHDGSVSFPRGKTVFIAGDRVFALARHGTAEALRHALIGRGR